MGRQPGSCRGEEAMWDPNCEVSWASPWDSWIVSPPEARWGVLDGASPTPTAGCSVMRYLFWKRPGGEGGGFKSLPWGSYCRAADRAPGTNRSTVSARLVTISSSPKSYSTPEDCTNLAVVGSVTCTRASGSSTGMWTLRLWDAHLANSSLTSTRSSVVMYLWPRSRASPIIREGGRKLACRTSIYDTTSCPPTKLARKAAKWYKQGCSRGSNAMPGATRRCARIFQTKVWNSSLSRALL